MRLQFQRSAGLLGYLIVSHAAAMILVFVSGINALAAVSFCLLIGFSFTRLSRRNGWFGGRLSTAEIRLNGDRYGYTIDGRGQIQGPYLLIQSVILGPLVVLTLKPEKTTRNVTLVLTRDVLDDEDWRQLCLRLRDPEFWD